MGRGSGGKEHGKSQRCFMSSSALSSLVSYLQEFQAFENRKKVCSRKSLTLVGEDCLKFNEGKHRTLHTGNFMCKYGLELTSWKAALQKGTYRPWWSTCSNVSSWPRRLTKSLVAFRKKVQSCA